MFKTILFTLIFVACLNSAYAFQAWSNYQDPDGFSLQIPAKWEVENDNGRIVVNGDHAERVIILPLKVEGNLTAKSAKDALLQLSKQFSPNQKWGMPNGGWEFGTNGVKAVGTDESIVKETSALWWTNADKGSAGFFYLVTSLADSFKSLEPTFARILKSFQITASSQKSAAPNQAQSLQFKQWIDPTENAFSLDVPNNWNISGGIKRGAETRSEILMQSPDGQILVKIGDATIPLSYAELTPTLASLGYREGQMASGTTQLRRFMTGAQFASTYIQWAAGQRCSNLKLVGGQDRNDYVRALASKGLVPNFASAYTAGEALYTCQSNGQKYIAYAFAETYKVDYQGTGTMWNVKALSGFLAQANLATSADSVLQRGMSTLRQNPQWVAGERQMNQQMYEDTKRYFEYSANLQKQMQADRWASMDRIAEQRGDLLQGRTQVVDPQTGQNYKVQNNSKYYWIDPTNNVIVGTDQPYKPNWDFKQMIENY